MTPKPKSDSVSLTFFVPLRPLSRNLLEKGKLRRRIALKNELKSAWLSASSDCAESLSMMIILTAGVRHSAMQSPPASALMTGTNDWSGSMDNSKPVAAKATL